ncbi:alpha/beta hydrolase [Actinosynnema sp. NPDC047251]|uniref:Alpha/beta hydrolase fold containing protein n=1 Tax=Saccharothrix espanaensis (strain ATCC 51144 / DSM 44229 / JCM 9112 / NBRC 15066 / NRRL 15764) TaxID=1179773 RepID=K0JTZ1_SACES|nr:alpha/beta hydrolase [Saccharothrix espanaensis]CCH27708.1 alpha/beta hydrolase fold containing protein [Saccharothrix espanaensis DSM 44229]
MSVAEFGGSGQGILLLHGLMSRASTWWTVAQWLKPYGRVVATDARGHGRNPRRGPFRTEDFVADAAETIERLDLGPAVVIGHSMGGLHAWALAATRPDLVRAVVAEDVVPDNTGRTVDEWRWYFDSWPVFESVAHVRSVVRVPRVEELFEERADGWHLIARLADLYEIAAEWGERSYWEFVDAIACPTLTVEAGRGGLRAGQMAEVARRTGGAHLLVPESGHVVHDEAPEVYRGAVEAFLSGSIPPV